MHSFLTSCGYFVELSTALVSESEGGCSVVRSTEVTSSSYSGFSKQFCTKPLHSRVRTSMTRRKNGWTASGASPCVMNCESHSFGSSRPVASKLQRFGVQRGQV